MNGLKKTWSPDEEQEMLTMIRKGESLGTIGRQHGRTENAIRLRFGLICKKQLETKTMQEICREYRVTSQQVQNSIDALDMIQEKNKPEGNIMTTANELRAIREDIRSLSEKMDRIYKHVRRLSDKKKE